MARQTDHRQLATLLDSLACTTRALVDRCYPATGDDPAVLAALSRLGYGLAKQIDQARAEIDSLQPRG